MPCAEEDSRGGRSFKIAKTAIWYHTTQEAQMYITLPQVQVPCRLLLLISRATEGTAAAFFVCAQGTDLAREPGVHLHAPDPAGPARPRSLRPRGHLKLVSARERQLLELWLEAVRVQPTPALTVRVDACTPVQWRELATLLVWATSSMLRV